MFEKKMKKESTEALPAKCAVTGADFDIIIEKRNGKIMLLEGKKNCDTSIHPIEGFHSVDKKTELKPIEVDGGIFTEKTYHCPVCGNKDIVRCGKCHNITCYDGSGTFKCAHCGNSGKVSGTIQHIQVYNSGYKKPFAEGDKPHYHGDKPYCQGDKPYYPGDK